MECEEVGASHDDSPPRGTPETAAVGPQGTLSPQPVPPVHAEENTTSPADNPPPEGNTQLSEEPAYQQLALPRVLRDLTGPWLTPESG